MKVCLVPISELLHLLQACICQQRDSLYSRGDERRTVYSSVWRAGATCTVSLSDAAVHTAQADRLSLLVKLRMLR